MSHRETLRMLLRLTEFIAGSRPRGLENDNEDEDKEEIVVSEHADEKMLMVDFLGKVREFVENKFKEKFPHRTFWWSGDVLMTSSGNDGFPAIWFEHWNPVDAELVCWFRLHCDYAIVNNELCPNRGHHRVSYEADGDSIWFWEGVMEFDGRVHPRQARVIVDGKMETCAMLKTFLLEQGAEGLVDGDDGDAVMDALHRLDRPPPY